MNPLSAISVLVILPLLFFCGGGSLGMTLHMVDDTPHGQHACCGVNEQDQGPVHVIDQHNPVSSILTGVAYLLVSQHVFVSTVVTALLILLVHQYMRSIWRTRGSPQIFSPVIQLFRFGLLHPKIW